MSKILSTILKLPMWTLVIASWGASIYVAYTKLMGMTWAVPAIYSAILALYIVGTMLRKEKKASEDESNRDWRRFQKEKEIADAAAEVRYEGSGNTN